MKLFSKIAYHSTRRKGLTKFNDVTDEDVAYTGEGAMVHGWGLYLQEDKELNIENYKAALGNEIIMEMDYNKIHYKLIDYSQEYKETEYYIDDNYVKEDDFEPGDSDVFNVMFDLASNNGSLEQAITDCNNAIAQFNNKFLDDDNVSVYVQQLHSKKEFLESLKGMNLNFSYKVVTVSQYTVEIPDDFVFIQEDEKLDPYFFEPSELNQAYEELINEGFKDKRSLSYKSFMKTLRKGFMNFNTFVTFMNIHHPEGMKGVTKCMLRHGIDGVEYYGGTDGHCYVIFNCKDLTIVNES